MRSVSVARSPRRQRVLAVLGDGCEHSNADLVREAKVRTVNSRFIVECRKLRDLCDSSISCRCRFVRPKSHGLLARVTLGMVSRRRVALRHNRSEFGRCVVKTGGRPSAPHF